MSKVAAGAPSGDEPRKAGSLPIPKSKRGLKGFINEVGREMKKVSWPTKSETNRLTLVVLTVCGMVVAALTAMSYAFEVLTNLITKGSV